MDKPYYPHKPISSIDTLAKTLGIHPKLLIDLSEKVENSYTEFVIAGKNEKLRTVYDPKFELKKLQKRINSRILEHVQYPSYLQGGIKDEQNKRDYIKNAGIHTESKTLISLDIKKYFDNIRPPFIYDVFKYFFRFPDQVCEILTRIVTLGNKLPQGACTSTYLANLLFFNSEYLIVSKLRGSNIKYSRLLDDVTMSSPDKLSNEDITEIIKNIAGMFKKYDLRLNNSKTKVEHKKHTADQSHFQVTGIWIGNNQPKLRKKERREIRHNVYICEKEYLKSPYTEEYHKFWNNCSGLVAKMSRLDHAQHKPLRLRLKKVFPLYDEHTTAKITHDVKKTLRASQRVQNKIGFLKRIGKLYYQLGILGRTDKALAHSLREQLKIKYSHLPTYKEIWK